MVVYVFDRIWNVLARLAGGPPNRCVVVYYHSVPHSQRGLFARQLDVILRCARPIRTGEYLDSSLGRHSVAVTFDDGFENFLTQALPELESRHIPATVFVIADGMNREFGSDIYAEKLLSLEQVRGLPDLVSIGSHTMSHPLLTHIEEAEACREIIESRRKLETMLGHPVMEFSFPFGGFNQKLVEFCIDAGYKAAYTTLPEFASGQSGEFIIGRVRVDPTDWPLEFRLKLAGAYRWLPLVFSLKRRIVSLATRVSLKRVVRPSVPRSMVR